MKLQKQENARFVVSIAKYQTRVPICLCLGRFNQLNHLPLYSARFMHFNTNLKILNKLNSCNCVLTKTFSAGKCGDTLAVLYMEK